MLLLLLPSAAALDVSNYQVILGTNDRMTLADDFSTQVVTTADTSTNTPLLIIGGPCANDMWQEYTDISCEEWPYPEGSGAVLSFDEGRVMLIGGTTQADTERLVAQLLETTDRTFVSDTFTTSRNEFIIREGESESLSTNNGRVVVSGLLISSGRIERITIDGERYVSLREGSSITTEDDLFIEIMDIGTNAITIRVTDFDDDDQDEDEVTLQEGDEDSVTINGNRIDIEDLEIDDDQLDVTIDGRAFRNMEEDDDGTVGDVTFTVENINDDEATFSFEEAEELDEGDDFTLEDGEDLSIDIEDESLDFDDVSITNSSLSVTVDGTSYTNLFVGSIIIENDITLRVTELTEDEATIRIDDVEE
jgi:hypothetical protein